MTARVRFSNGQVVQYNSACKRIAEPGGQTILRDSNDVLVAVIPPGCNAVVEFAHPCSVEWRGKDLEALVKGIKDLGRPTTYHDSLRLVELKKHLEGFDARRRVWK